MKGNATSVESIKTYLAMIATMERSERAFHRFILDHGRVWPGQARPKGFKRGPARQCFRNSMSLLVSSFETGLTYVEGFAASGDVGFSFPVHHGWLINSDGRVIDLTWKSPETSVYFGIPFKSDYVRKRVLESEHWCSLLDNRFNDHALVAGKHRIDEAVADFFEREAL